MPFAWPEMSRVTFAWALYDFAYWAAASVTLQTLIPVLFRHKLLDPSHAPIIWGYVVGFSTLVGAILAPVVGALSDSTGHRKLFLFAAGVISTVGGWGYLAMGHDWEDAAIFVAIALVGNMQVVSLYNSLLAFVTSTDHEATQASGWATALGNLGPAILLSALGFWDLELGDLNPQFLWPTFIIAAVWWAVFSLPLFLWVPVKKEGGPAPRGLSMMFSDMVLTFREMLQNSHLCKFVVAMFIFNDAAAAMFQLALIFGASIGIDTKNLFAAVVMNRCLSIFMAIGWSFLTHYLSPRIGFMIVMVILTAGTLVAFFMSTAVEFWILQVILGAAGTGSFIFARVLLLQLTPSHKTGQFFGFLASIGSMGGFFGPVLYSSVGSLTGAPRDGFVLLAFFALGGLLLFGTVDFELGKQAAHSQSIPDADDETTDPHNEPHRPAY